MGTLEPACFYLGPSGPKIGQAVYWLELGLGSRPFGSGFCTGAKAPSLLAPGFYLAIAFPKLQIWVGDCEIKVGALGNPCLPPSP